MTPWKETVLFLAYGVVIAVLLHLASFSTWPPFPRETFLIDRLFSHKEEIRALAAGNSHNRGLDFETLGIRGFHVWAAGNDLFETRYQIERLLPRLPKVDTLFLVVSYFSFRYDNTACEIEDRGEIRRKLYATLPSLSWIDGDLTNFLQGKLATIVRSDHWYKVFRTWLLHDLHPPRNMEGFFVDPRDGARIEPQQYRHYDSEAALIERTESEKGVTRDLRLIADMMQHRPDLPEATEAALRDTIAFLQARRVRVVLYTPPYFHRYTERFDPETIAEMKGKMRAIRRDLGVEYYDLSDDPEISYDYRNFFDEDHLNLTFGAPRFSAKLKRLLASEARAGR